MRVYGYGRRLVYRVQDRRPHRPGGPAWVDVSDEVITPGPLDRFLTHRWGLHEEGPWGRYYMGLTHPVWPFRRCDPLDWDTTPLMSAGVTPLRAEPDSVLFSPGVAVRFGLPGR
ncbi:DUF2071 domain-containing protein [Streptomyces sp. NPDC057806]|uniref:DUF2071 domain-containing protein n=1 Tax=Streptomyces sp. NPDC057806 TaxID=3346255 RepID=UPI0036B61900